LGADVTTVDEEQNTLLHKCTSVAMASLLLDEMTIKLQAQNLAVANFFWQQNNYKSNETPLCSALQRGLKPLALFFINDPRMQANSERLAIGCTVHIKYRLNDEINIAKSKIIQHCI